MAKSMRSKREKRLRALRREIVEPLNQPKEAAKLAALEAALAAPKLPVRTPAASMDISTSSIAAAHVTNSDVMDVEMAEGSQTSKALKPAVVIGKRLKKKLKIAKKKGHHGKGKIRRKHNV